MATDCGAKEARNFAESSLECWSHFKMTLLHVEMIALKIHRYHYKNIQVPL